MLMMTKAEVVMHSLNEEVPSHSFPASSARKRNPLPIWNWTNRRTVVSVIWTESVKSAVVWIVTV